VKENSSRRGQNNYKRVLIDFKMSKRGQVAIFVIVALVIVGVLVVVFGFSDSEGDLFQGDEANPEGFLKSCLEPELKKNSQTLALQGGYRNPEGFIIDNGDKIKYLCYTSEYYETCVVQQPLLKEHFEKELSAMIDAKADSCLKTLETEYEKRGYEITIGEGDSEVKTSQGKISVILDSPVTVEKESVQEFDTFEVGVESNMYELLLVSSSMIELEAVYGDAETSLYMRYYPDLNMEKTKLSDGTTIYKIENVITGEEFRFASRSLAWPAGFE
jgi:hypothetical protein